MYKLIFYFFYRYFSWRNDSSPRFGAVCGLFLTVGLHIILAFVLVQKWVGHTLVQSPTQSYSLNKAFYMLIVFPFLLLTIKFFNKTRTDKIIGDFDNRDNSFSFTNWVVFVVAFVSPLILLPLLLRK